MANTTGAVTSTNANTSTMATANLIVTAPPLTSPTIAKAFSPTTIGSGATSTITFTLSNVNPGILTSANFTDTLTNLSIATTAIGGTCVGVTNSPALVPGATGVNAVNLTIPNLPPGGCTVSVQVTSSILGARPNTSSGVATTQTPAAGAVSNTATLTVVPLPSLVFMKTVAVLSDPFNGGTSPKNIPGAIVLYTLRVTNTGAGTVDSNTLIIADPIPANTELFVGDLAGANSGPIGFVQGTPTSALSWTYTTLGDTLDDVDFSNVGCNTWTYVPTLPFDPAVNCIRLNPKGTMSGTGGGNPYFDLSFRVRIK
jgi:trimeric autotransporter adhesin